MARRSEQRRFKHAMCFLLGPTDTRKEGPSLLLVLKWGGELTPAGRVQAEELGRAFRCMYPGGQGETHTSCMEGQLIYSHVALDLFWMVQFGLREHH
jgi:hypothetical protein